MKQRNNKFDFESCHKIHYVRAVEVEIRGVDFLMLPHPLTSFEIQNIITRNVDLMVLIQKIIYLK